MKAVKICCVTSSRSEYDLLRNVLIELEKNKLIDLYLLATGSHLKKDFGKTINYIKKDKFNNLFEIDILNDDDDAVSMTDSISSAECDSAHLTSLDPPT